jgi:hypothetical protein
VCFFQYPQVTDSVAAYLVFVPNSLLTQVTRNVLLEPRLLPGGGATEMAIATSITKSVEEVEGIARWPYAAVAQALEVIPRTLAENCGGNVIRILTELRTKHSQPEIGSTFGVNGTTGVEAYCDKLKWPCNFMINFFLLNFLWLAKFFSWKYEANENMYR